MRTDTLEHGTTTSHTKELDAQRPTPGGHQGLLRAAVALSHALETEMDRALEVVGLSARGFVALLEIDREPPLSQRTLSARLGLGEGTTSELLRRLERRGLIQRRTTATGGADDSHRRRRGRPARTVVLKAAGRATLAKAKRIALMTEADWARRLALASNSPFAGVRAQGLQRWLRESLQSLAAPRPTDHPSGSLAVDRHAMPGANDTDSLGSDCDDA
jgi:DNA-binding MarR family transcriptional regulator